MRVGFIGVILAVFTGIGLLVAVERRKVLPTAQQVQSNGVSPLTAAEERDLKRFLPQMLRWSAQWLMGPMPCGDTEINVANEIKRYEGGEIEVKLITSDDRVTVFFDTIHLRLWFRRLHELGLSPPEFEEFCERDYEEYLSVQREGRESMGTGVWQTRWFHLGALTESSQTEDQWSEEKKQLYASLMEVVKRQARFYCSPRRKTVRARVPDFEIGDPWIVVLFDASLDDRPAMLINFDRDPTTGTYRAEFSKDFGLPDELAAVEAAIKRRRVAEVVFNCDELKYQSELEKSEEVLWLSEEELRGLAKQQVEPKSSGVYGELTVSVLIDADGKVRMAHAVAGLPQLRQAAVKAAYRWRFKPLGRKLAGELRFQFK